jgi:NhaP-type Na+/H+ or K+/H+ antiporter
MSEYQILAVIAGFAFFYSLFASRLERTPINGALIYVAVGVLCGPSVLGLANLTIGSEGLKLLAELTLAIVLFTDSANANLPVLRKFERLPIRLLLVGLPLTIALGFGVAIPLFSSLTLVQMALLATMLAPTDAALGKAVVTNKSVPAPVREGLNVESGLNDGICVPVLLIFLAIATNTGEDISIAALIVQKPLQAIGIGALVGVSYALVGSFAFRICSRRGWIAGTWMQVPVVALAIFCFATAQRFDGSGFIASFVGGMIFGGLTRKHKEEVLEAAEGVGDMFSLITWFAFGALITSDHLFQSGWQPIVYAILSLTLVRMIPVALCMIDRRLDLPTTLFLGWFGPRGLASIVFLVMVMDANIPGSDPIMSTVTWTILLSVVAHGVTAIPLARRYGELEASPNDANDDGQASDKAM